MRHFHYQSIEEKEVDMEGADGVSIRWLINDEQGAENFYMRRFEVLPGGKTPKHAHAYEHEVYVLEGSGRVWDSKAGEWKDLAPGHVVFVPPNEEHSFEAASDSKLVFLCLIPASAGK